MGAILFIKVFGRITLIIIQIIIGILLYVWLKPFLSDKKLAAYAAAVHVAFIAVWDAVPFEIGSMTGWFSLILLMLGVLYFPERKNLEQKIFLSVMFIAIRLATLQGVSEINFFITDITTRSEFLCSSICVMLVEFVVQKIAWAALCGGMLYFAIRLFHRVFTAKHENMTLSELIIMLAPTVPIFLMRQMESQYLELWNDGILNGIIERNYPGNAVCLIYDAAAYSLLLLVVSLYQKNKSKSEQIKELALLHFEREALEEHIKQTEKIYEAQRSLRHDLANHIQTIERLVEAGEVAASREYLSDMQAELSRATRGVVTGNSVVDIVLGEYMRQAEECGISFEVRFPYPSDTELGAFDVSVILSNALSNAVRAAKKCEKPYIRVNAVRKKNVLLISITNNYTGRLQIDEETGAPDRIEGQGIGLKNIRHTAEKYQGAMDIELTDNGGEKEFCLTVMLQIG